MGTSDSGHENDSHITIELVEDESNGGTKNNQQKKSKVRKMSWLGRMIVSLVVNKHKNSRERKKSLISRNKAPKRGGLKESLRRMTSRTMSMVSLASTNFTEFRYLNFGDLLKSEVHIYRVSHDTGHL